MGSCPLWAAPSQEMRHGSRRQARSSGQEADAQAPLVGPQRVRRAAGQQPIASASLPGPPNAPSLRSPSRSHSERWCASASGAFRVSGPRTVQEGAGAGGCFVASRTGDRRYAQESRQTGGIGPTGNPSQFPTIPTRGSAAKRDAASGDATDAATGRCARRGISPRRGGWSCNWRRATTSRDGGIGGFNVKAPRSQY